MYFSLLYNIIHNTYLLKTLFEYKFSFISTTYYNACNLLSSLHVLIFNLLPKTDHNLSKILRILYLKTILKIFRYFYLLLTLSSLAFFLLYLLTFQILAENPQYSSDDELDTLVSIEHRSFLLLQVS